MKPIALATWLLLGLLSCHEKADDVARTLQVPITLQQGYGPFFPSFGSLNPDHPDDPLWGSILLPLKGKPANWSRLTQTMVWLDAHQLVYQNVKAGRIAQQDYRDLQRDWKWKPDTTQLAASLIKCYVYILKGFDKSRGKWAVMIDTNNDLDFSNETPFYPQPIPLKPVPDTLANTQLVQYEVYREGKVERAQVPLAVGTLNGDFVYGSPQHAVATIRQGDDTHELFVYSPTGRPSFESAQLYLPSTIRSSGKADPQKIIHPGETIEIDGVLYTNRGVADQNRLMLETTDGTAVAVKYSLQVGHQFKPFSARDVSTGRLLSLAHLRGKYVYIDFWGTWCKGCVEDLPALKTSYERIDKKRVAFLGIACHDTPEQVRRFVRDRHLLWPQIVSDDANRLADRYQVTAFPTSVLLDPEGIVIARNLRGKALQEKLTELTLVK